MFLRFSRTQLRLLRNGAGLTCEVLAARVGLSVHTIGAYEKGHSVPSTGALGRLAVALGCSVDDLFEREQVESVA